MRAEGRPAPSPLVVAASLVGIEGVVLLGGAVLTLVTLSRDQLTIGLATAAFFAAYGAVLVAAGVGLARGLPWGRGPALLTQLIALGLAWNVRERPGLAVALAVVGVVVVAGLIHPASTDALEGRRTANDE